MSKINVCIVDVQDTYIFIKITKTDLNDKSYKSEIFSTTLIQHLTPGIMTIYQQKLPISAYLIFGTN